MALSFLSRVKKNALFYTAFDAHTHIMCVGYPIGFSPFKSRTLTTDSRFRMGNEMSCCGPRNRSSSNSSSLDRNRTSLDDGAKTAVELIVEETNDAIELNEGSSVFSSNRKGKRHVVGEVSVDRGSGKKYMGDKLGMGLNGYVFGRVSGEEEEEKQKLRTTEVNVFVKIPMATGNTIIKKSKKKCHKTTSSRDVILDSVEF